MNHRMVIALATWALLIGGNEAFAEDRDEAKPPMHMHKSEMDHRSDKEVATEYKSEATQLREKAHLR